MKHSITSSRKNSNKISVNLDAKCRHKIERMAKDQGKTFSDVVRDIIEVGTGYSMVARKRREISLPREIMSELFIDLTEDQMKGILDLLYSFAKNDLKYRYGRVNYSNVETGLRKWADFNGLSMNVIEDEDEINGRWLTCKHGMGVNWSNIHARSVSKLLDKLGGCGISKTEIDLHMFSIFYRIPIGETEEEIQPASKGDIVGQIKKTSMLKKKINNFN